jgi:hypothetical protein
MKEHSDWTGPGGSAGGWTCDECGERITRAGDGWLEWVKSDRTGTNGQREGFSRTVRIVHQIQASPLRGKSKDGCYLNDRREMAKDGGITSGAPLETFLGNEGLILLLSLVSSEKEAEQEFLIAIQRLHVFGYEQAMPFFQQAIEDGEIEVNLPRGFYLENQIEIVREKYVNPVEQD